MSPMCTLLFLLLGTAVGSYQSIKVSVDKKSNQSQESYTLDNDACIRDLKYRVRQPAPPTNITVELIEDGRIIDEFHNDSTEIQFAKYSFYLNTTFVKNGTMIRVTVIGNRSSVTVSFKISEKGSCLSDKPTTTASTTIRQHQEQDGRSRLILLLICLFVVAFILALIVSLKYRKRLLTLYRHKRAQSMKQVATISSVTSSVTIQLNPVNADHDLKRTSFSQLRSHSCSKMNDDSRKDYAELRTDDTIYAVPDIRISQASLRSSAPSLEDSSEDVKYHLPMYNSLSALNQHYAQPITTNIVSATRSMDSLPIHPIDVDEYMSMGSSFPTLSIHNYNRPMSSQSMENSKTATRATCCTLPCRDQDDYMSMFSQEENYSNIGKALGESFRDQNYVRKYKKKARERTQP